MLLVITGMEIKIRECCSPKQNENSKGCVVLIHLTTREKYFSLTLDRWPAKAGHNIITWYYHEYAAYCSPPQRTVLYNASTLLPPPPSPPLCRHCPHNRQAQPLQLMRSGALLLNGPMVRPRQRTNVLRCCALPCRHPHAVYCVSYLP